MYDTLIGLWGLFASAFISSTIMPGGSEAVLAYMVAKNLYSIQALLIVATVGNTLGALTTWGLGMMAAKKFPLATLLPQKKQRALALVEQRGIWVLFFSWLPVIGDVLCFAGGWLKLPFISACLIILFGKFARYAMIVWLFT
ncbi:MAG: DedA family protein [Methylococcaceae bacterium]|nr:DedA family protein [Methylococcaceae bacterium]MDD1610944.1 DedA family protein [Methylococcaceae bacterium]